MKRYLLILATLLGIMVMHGGLGSSSCNQMAMGWSPAVTGTAVTGMEMASAHHAPAHHAPAHHAPAHHAPAHHAPATHAPAAPVAPPTRDSHEQAGCVAPQPPAPVTAPAPQLDHSTLLGDVTQQPTVTPRHLLAIGGEPPPSRQLDPIGGLGILRI